MFQVSEAFGVEIEEVLKVEGIQSNAVTRRRVEVVQDPLPPTIVPPAQVKTFLSGIAQSVGVGANLLTIGAAITGIAACNVM